MPNEEDLLNIVMTAIQEDPTITDPNGVVPSVGRKGPLFRKQTVVRLDGNVRFEAEVGKVEEIIQRKLPEVTIENHLRAS